MLLVVGKNLRLLLLTSLLLWKYGYRSDLCLNGRWEFIWIFMSFLHRKKKWKWYFSQFQTSFPESGLHWTSCKFLNSLYFVVYSQTLYLFFALNSSHSVTPVLVGGFFFVWLGFYFFYLLVEDPSSSKLHRKDRKFAFHIPYPSRVLEAKFCSTFPIYSYLCAFAKPSVYFPLSPKCSKNALFCLPLVLFKLVWQVMVGFRIASATWKYFFKDYIFAFQFQILSAF